MVEINIAFIDRRTWRAEFNQLHAESVPPSMTTTGHPSSSSIVVVVVVVVVIQMGAKPVDYVWVKSPLEMVS